MIAGNPARGGAPGQLRTPVDWHILTGEYPPQPGGVSDYTRLVARALADAGDRVTVWAPPCAAPDERHPGVVVRRLPDRFGPRALVLLGRELDRLPGRKRILVQYVPHAFGLKAVNVPFCLWVWFRRHESIWVMFHEVAYPSGAEHSLAENALAVVTRRMAALVGGAAERIFVSIPAWRTMVERLVRPRTAVTWLPVPSNVPVVVDPKGADAVRARLAGEHAMVGHLGTYGRLIGLMLAECVPDLLATADCHLLLLGRGGGAMRDALIAAHPECQSRIHAPGPLSEGDLSRHVAACDVMLQPYPDGVSGRRTSVMVALAHGRPVVTTVGRLSEPIWADDGAVVLVPADEPRALAAATSALLGQPTRLAELSARARTLYAGRFDLGHTLDALRSTSASEAPP